MLNGPGRSCQDWHYEYVLQNPEMFEVSMRLEFEKWVMLECRAPLRWRGQPLHRTPRRCMNPSQPFLSRHGGRPVPLHASKTPSTCSEALQVWPCAVSSTKCTPTHAHDVICVLGRQLGGRERERERVATGLGMFPYWYHVKLIALLSRTSSKTETNSELTDNFGRPHSLTVCCNMYTSFWMACPPDQC
jgi:hypothetical protein